MKLRKLIARTVLVLVVAIQVIRPEQNNYEQVAAAGFVTAYGVPDSINSMLQSSCYDCHSNHTRYPWYGNIQPLGWILSNHIKQGKFELNFSELSGYSTRKQISKLKAIASQIEDNEMPLSSYTMLHKTARLSAGQKAIIISCIKNTADSISNSNL
jgi:hypothetical protein